MKCIMFQVQDALVSAFSVLFPWKGYSPAKRDLVPDTNAQHSRGIHGSFFYRRAKHSFKCRVYTPLR